MDRRYFGSEVHGHYLNNKLSVEELSSIGLSSWPPKYYTCSFCKRQFSSAQALGGHMNVHRRDRARLRSQLPSWVLECTTPNPNPNSSPPQPSPSPSSSSSISPFAKSLPCNKPSDVDDLGPRRNPFYDEINEELMKMKSRRPRVVGFGEFKGFAQPKCELDHQVLVKKKEIISLDLEMGFKDPEEILDLELRLGYRGNI